MKKLYVLSALFAVVFSGAVQAQNCRLKADTSYSSHDGDEFKNVDHYLYDNDGILRRIDKYSDFMGTLNLYAYDSVYYASNGFVDSTLTFEAMNDEPTGAALRNTWSGGLLIQQTRVSQQGMGDTGYDTTDYTYVGSDLTALSQRRWTNTTLDDELLITDISFTAGNLTSGKMGGTDDVVITYDDKLQILPGLVLSDDFLSVFSTNNATSAAPALDPSDPFFAVTFTYADDKVATMEQEYEDGSERNVYDYECEIPTGIVSGAVATEVSFFPNPSATGVFQLNSAKEFNQATVTNGNGQVIQQYTIAADALTVDLSGMPAGIYTVQLSGDAKVAYAKLVK